MKETTAALLRMIEASDSLQALRTAATLPEPDADEGYYFVSYSHRDYKPVLRDILLFSEEGLGIWYDRGLESGKSWVREVSKKISSYSCRGVLFYLSEAFLASPSCLHELCHFLTDGGDREGLFLVPAALYATVRPRLDAALTASGAEGEALGALHTLLGRRPPLLLSAPLSKKLSAIRRLRAPSLLSYRAVPLVPGLPYYYATVTDLRDRNAKEVTVPATCRIGKRRYPVRGIATGAFRSCEMLQEVRMGRFHAVDDAAFSRCPSLGRITLGRPVRFLGFGAGIIGRAIEQCPRARLYPRGGAILYCGSFRGREDLTEVDLPRGERIAGDAFFGCTALRTVTLKRGDRLDGRTFTGCTALLRVRLPHGNRTRHMKETFAGCHALTEVTLPSALRTLGAGVFRDCYALTALTLPRHLTEIDAHAFAGCHALCTVVVDCRDCRFLENTPYTRRTALDRLFPKAERFYFRHMPETPPFDTPFSEVPSDRRHYRLFIKEGTHCEDA